MGKIILSAFADEYSSSFTEQLEAMRSFGIGYVEIRGVDGKNVSVLTPTEVGEMKRKLDHYGIGVSAIGSPLGKIKLDGDFDGHFETARRVFETANTLGTKYIRMFSFYIPQDKDPASYRDEVLKRLKAFIDYAKEQGIVLLHENEGDIYGEGIDENVFIQQNLYCDNFKMVFDPANFAQKGFDTIEAIERLIPYVEYMHVKDHKKDVGIVPAGHGDGNVKYVIEKLFAKGYEGFISLEPHLGSFKGLAELELDGKSHVEKQAGEDTFTIAANALEEIFKQVM